MWTTPVRFFTGWNKKRSGDGVAMRMEDRDERDRQSGSSALERGPLEEWEIEAVVNDTFSRIWTSATDR